PPAVCAAPSLSIFPSGSRPPPHLHFSLHDALPISPTPSAATSNGTANLPTGCLLRRAIWFREQISHRGCLPGGSPCLFQRRLGGDRKSTRLNSSHVKISYAGFCLKKKTSRRAAPRT